MKWWDWALLGLGAGCVLVLTADQAQAAVLDLLWWIRYIN
jgi:hypothetical protein